MIFKQIDSGGDRNFSYLVASNRTGEGALIDPAPDPDKVFREIDEGIEIKYIINTHFHYDHSGGNDYFLSVFNDKKITFINSEDSSSPKDGEVFSVGEIMLEIILTPGHTPESICIKAGNRLITGDTLFVGKVGGTYSEKDAKTQFFSLKRLIALPPETEVWPGHDVGQRPSSTIGDEIMTNPFIIRINDFNDFFWLKQNWAGYKAENGIK